MRYEVTGVNDAPRVVDPQDPEQTQPDMARVIPIQNGEDNRLSDPVDVGALFVDDDGDVLTYAAEGLPPGLIIDPISGIITGTPNGDASQGGPNGDGLYTAVITAQDPFGETAETSVIYAVSNPSPVAENDNFVTPEDTLFSQNILDNDSDPDGDSLTIDVAALPDGTLIEFDVPLDVPEGQVTLSADGNLVFEPARNFNGVFAFGYTVTDSDGGTNAASVTIDVTPVIDEPVLDRPREAENGNLIVTGIGEPGAVITVTFPDGSTDTVTVEANGVFMAISQTPQPSGDIFAVQRDVFGNAAGQAVESFVAGLVFFVEPETVDIKSKALLSVFDTPASGADPYQWMNAAAPDLKIWFAENTLTAGDIGGARYGDANFRGGMVAVHIPDMDHDCAYIVVEAIAGDHDITVQLGSSLQHFCDTGVQSWAVDQKNGQALPTWAVMQDHMIYIDRPLDQTVLDIDIRAVLDNGQTVQIPVQIDLRTGTVIQTGDMVMRGALLSETLTNEARSIKLGDTALIRALVG